MLTAVVQAGAKGLTGEVVDEIERVLFRKNDE
jgi:hypothetical protein